MIENPLIFVVIFMILIMQLSLIIILAVRSKKILQLINDLKNEVKQLKNKLTTISATSVYTDDKSLKKQDPIQKNNTQKIPPLKTNEELLFIREMKIDKNKKLIEMDIKVEHKT